jgi:hypothetical protein
MAAEADGRADSVSTGEGARSLCWIFIRRLKGAEGMRKANVYNAPSTLPRLGLELDSLTEVGMMIFLIAALVGFFGFVVLR